MPFYEFSLLFNLTHCLTGEIFDYKLSACIKCKEGYYSLNPEMENCQKCPNEASKCSSNKISLKLGYWKFNGSTQIFSCFPNIESCL